MIDGADIALLALVGLVAGTLNVVAGGGSFLTLPVLIFLGLPPGVANGSNRVGIVLQNVVASISFDRHGVLDRRALWWAALPAVLGAGAGTWLALRTPDDTFQRVLAILMVALSLISLWRPTAREAATDAGTARTAGLASGFLLVGLYAGFVQAGVGFLVLAVTSAVGLDLVRGNAVKVLTLLAANVLSLALFAAGGKVDWTAGLALAAGTTAGGLLGARLTVRRGDAWLRTVVTATVILFAVRLWWTA